ncbi:MAG: thymidylate synthase [Minisyncoccia bacterium]
MKQYLNLLQTIQNQGYFTDDRTGVGTQALPGHAYTCELKMDDNGVVHNYPLLTTKKMFMRGTFEELMWKLRGETNIQSLVKKDINIWTEWPFKKWLEKTGLMGTFPIFIDDAKSDYTDKWKEKISEFKTMIINDDDFAKEFGELGPTYGHNFRRFGEIKTPEGNIYCEGIDQLMETIDKILNKPEDRRNIITLWDPHANKKSLLPPCPCFYQVFANQEGTLHMNLYQRSCDTFLGVPFNTAQDSLLLILLAKVTDRKPKIFNHFFGDAHIYNNHKNQVAKQLSREPFPLPSIKINRETKNILDFEFEDIELINYQCYPGIKAPVAV